ncbi:MAG: hypothetical protein COV66_02525 [Nitrospinae bacterium CG11_big_fil_rev_8_21_14_0_20_45_15]|nr:MAG: hypothetical protein COV66_02525 [Nitrospinae bacterium CG11_big_fil_rev_8_21_14_0_20_45_15]
MTETKEPAKEEKKEGEEIKKELGIMDSYGSFPVWMLKGIQLITPDILITKTPAPKPKVRN